VTDGATRSHPLSQNRLDNSIGKHLDEVFIKINGEHKYLWRAVDQDGNVLDILVQNRRDKAAARRFFRRLMKKTGTVPRVVVTDKLRSVSCWVAREGRMWLKLPCR
jgi:putative transposase